MIKRFLILELTRLLALGVVTVVLTAQSATPGAQISAPTEPVTTWPRLRRSPREGASR